MLNRVFRPELPHNAVLYARMSSDKQNPRSPDQQFAEIERRLENCRYPWNILEKYRDDGASGKYLRRREGLQKMLLDIRTGKLQVDLILIDTLERLGRVDDLPLIRKELYETHGVLILTAESNFADPTTPQGKAYGAFEAMRATEENRIKSHQVRRGKRDAAQRGYWPGGTPPFGYELKSEFGVRNGRHVPTGSKLAICPEHADIIRRLFERAHATGEGQVRLAQWLNTAGDIPAEYKPFYSATIGFWLGHEIYYGELVWPKHTTGIVNDSRRIERNPEEEILRVPNFCEPIVSREVWDAVQRGRQAHREARHRAAARRDKKSQKQIAPLAPGMVLKHPLSGLVRCGICDSSMVVSGSGRKSKAGKSYAYYVCPRAIDRTCTNRKRVPVEWLQKTVFGLIGERLFPTENG